ncbi:hypothetical protein GGR52DRAFT_307355 [Hypoxylon sp. FL1284]|nr:hypothetical protein GGR52DRAFT_307355 [Hypoxylon sp. FL1284]
MAPTREQLLQTAKQFVADFNEFTPESVVRTCSPKCPHRLIPRTLKSPPSTNAEYSAFVANLKKVMPAYELKIAEDPVVDTFNRKVSVYTTSKSDTTIGTYQNEFLWTFTMSEDGKSIDDILEYADSLYTSEWLPKLLKAASEV